MIFSPKTSVNFLLFVFVSMKYYYSFPQISKVVKLSYITLALEIEKKTILNEFFTILCDIKERFQ